MLRNPKRSYIHRRFFSADHVSNWLPDNHTEADEGPALRRFSTDIRTCSKCGGATGRHQVRCDAARVGCVGQAASTTNREWRLLAGNRRVGRVAFRPIGHSINWIRPFSNPFNDVRRTARARPCAQPCKRHPILPDTVGGQCLSILQRCCWRLGRPPGSPAGTAP